MGTKRKPKMEGCIGGEDLISKLPDDILVRVLSLLALKEVIRCGALSRRWTTLLKLVSMTLKFVRKKDKPSVVEETKTEFIHQVNQILDSYPGETLMELSISYPMMYQSLEICSQFDKWVRFAMAKQVRKFSMDLCGHIRELSHPAYQFPPILCDTKRLRSGDIGLPRCTLLTDLRLECVNVTNKHMEHFLKCCPFLESLCVIRSYSLTFLKVDGSIRLKFLEIQDCKKLQVFEIRAPNLISFKYIQHPMKIMPLKWAPQLNELVVSDYGFLVDNFHMYRGYLAQIETLSLVIEGFFIEGAESYSSPEFRWPTGIPTLRNLKHLIICAAIFDNDSLLCFSRWIEASPLLKRFVFEESGFRCRTSREAEKPRMCAHHHLKEVEFFGFVGDVSDTELAMYIIENAVNLQKIVFDCRDPPFEDKGPEQRSRAIGCARELQSLLSPDVEFVLIVE